jgi:formylglycine-generating enzyme required for sulfatase activity
MGSPPSETGRNPDETLHQVTITKAFFLGATEVTQAEWQSLMGKNPSNNRACGSNCPVEEVSWYDSIAFANAASLRDGYATCYQKPGGGSYDAAAAAASQTPTWNAGLACVGYRLPTEAEWEYAARAGTTTAFYTGSVINTSCMTIDTNLGPAAWYCANSGMVTHPVGMKQPNAWGLYDMLGNVWEWVWDWYTPYGAAATDPIGAPSGMYRVNRGASWFSPSDHARAAYRYTDTPQQVYSDTGLRIARSVP